jgi:hypothetical protein
MLRPEGHVFIYMRKGCPPVDIQPDSEVHSLVAWEDIPRGFMRMTIASEFVRIKWLWNWPPKENEDVNITEIKKKYYERYKDRFLPWRLQDLGL